MKKGNLYYYFKNKEEILFACHQYSLDEPDRAARRRSSASGLPADEKLRRLIVAFVHTILDELHGTALFLDLEALVAGAFEGGIVRRDTFDRGVRRVLEEGMATGVVRGRRRQAAAPSRCSVPSTGSRGGSTRTAPRALQEIADQFADFLIGGLRAKRQA